MPNVIKARCPEDHPCPCVRICSVGAIQQQGYEAPTIDTARCVLCNKCIQLCPKKAIVE